MVTSDDMDSVFGALANTHRRAMLDVLRSHPGATVGEVAARFDVSRVSVMKHLAVLERAGLVVSRKDGPRRRLHLNTVPLQAIHERWTSAYTEPGATRVLDIKAVAEAAARRNPEA